MELPTQPPGAGERLCAECEALSRQMDAEEAGQVRMWINDYPFPIEPAELFGLFEPAPVTPLDDLAREYYDRAEAYDRTVCTGPIRDGSILPASRHEHSLINRNATALLRELGERAERMGYTRNQLHQAMKKCSSTK